VRAVSCEGVGVGEELTRVIEMEVWGIQFIFRGQRCCHQWVDQPKRR
jgi:hypothetical protein